jgi:dipeptidyl aminopeptidase/acylaminoacyl peptidase
MKKVYLSLFVLFFVTNIFAQGYKKPPQNVMDVLNAPAIPQSSISPNGKTILLSEPLRYPPISELAQPMLRLAGIRINPNTNGQHRQFYSVKLTLKSVKDGKETAVQLPPNAQIIAPQWTANGEKIAFGNITPTGIELWILDVDSGKAKKLKNVQVNTTMGSGFQWMPDQKSL